MFLDFLRKYNNEYNNINKPTDIIDDVEIYFDNKIGIIAPSDYPSKRVISPIVKEPSDEYSNKFKYNILKVIEKRNKEEEAIAEMIKEFEAQIDAFFNYITTINDGTRLIAKILDGGTAFSQDEIYKDFSKIYRKYIILNKGLSEFFKRETKDSLTQLCDDFERTIKNNDIF